MSRDHTRQPTRRPARHRSLTAFLSLAGLLLWVALTAPQAAPAYALAPRLLSASGDAARWLGALPALGAATGGGGAPSATADTGEAGGAALTPGACSSSGVSAVGSNLMVPRGTWVCGDALVVGGDAQVEGHVQGAVTAVGGHVVIAGEVDGDVTAIGGDITIEPGAQTGGQLHAIGGRVTVAPGASAQVTPQADPATFSGPYSVGSRSHAAGAARIIADASAFWLGLLFWVSATLGLTSFAPEAIGHVRYTIAQRFGVSFLAGAAAGVLGALLGLALFITCLGIPLTLALALGLWIAWVVGTVAFGSWIGATLLRGLRHGRDPSLLASTLIGVTLLSLLKAVPGLGLVVSVVVGCVALGAALLTLLSARRVSYAHLRW